MGRFRGFIFLGIGALLIVLGVQYLARLPGQRLANLEQLPRSLPKMAAPAARDRILVLAPHCDDETLACGGLIELALKARAKVVVVLATNGDGFPYAVERFFGEPEVTPTEYLTMGAERQAETLAAVSTLGLKPAEVTFLGYPDGGTALMWLEHWGPDHPYTNPHTSDNHNPYADSLRPGAPYCARSMIDDLKTAIARFKPTVIFCPHPNDDHPDHWALNCYTLAALYELGIVDRVPLRLYLVHRGERGDWPIPRGLHASDPMVPPADLVKLTTRWKSLPLTPQLVQRKERAITRYRSQMMVMRGFMLTFARSTELFGELSLVRLPVVDAGRVTVDGRTDDWSGMAVTIPDPTQDMSRVDANPAGDLAAAYVARDARRLYVRLDTYEPVSPDVLYEVRLNVLSKGTVGPPVSYALQPGHATAGIEFRASGKHIEMSVPWPGHSNADGLMLGADTRYEHQILDKTAWMLLRP